MEFKCLCTGSTGNCYLVNLGGNSYILDAGCSKIENITKEINLNNVKFAFISHIHKDHSRLVDKLLKRGVNLILGYSVEDFVEVEDNVYVFPVKHGDCKCGAIVIQHDNECILYATDFNLCEYDLSVFKFTSIIVECNFIESTANQMEDFKVRRQINTHMGLNGLQIFLNSLDLSQCKEIYLCHMSQDLGDRTIMGATIYSKYRKPTAVCRQYGGVDWYGRG